MADQREMCFTLLTTLNYSVHTVSSGEDALDYLRTNKVDLVILDMIMDPGMDGLDTYREVLRLNPGQKAVIASGYSETERIKEVQRLGASQTVKKP